MSEEQAKQFIEQATQSIQSGQYEQALPLIEQAAALTPTNSEIFVLQGICYSQLAQPDAATDSFRKAITLSPYNSKAYYNMAVHQYALGNKIEALEMARETASIDTKHTGARQMVARIEDELRSGTTPGALAGETATPSNLSDPLSPPLDAPPVQSSRPEPVAPPPSGADYKQPAAPTVSSEYKQMAPPDQQSAPQPGGTSARDQRTYGGTPYVAPYNPAHSLAFVEKMGGAWTAIGWLLALVNAAAWAMLVTMFSSIMQHPGDAQAIQTSVQQSSYSTAISVCTYTSMFGGLLWTILDLLDRKGSFLWLLLQLPCGCCGMSVLSLPIYILGGRK